MAKTVLCYGDSITWGFNPTDGSRFSFEQRWPGVLQAALGTGYRIVEEGLTGRTVATDSWGLPHRDGRAMLGPMLGSHAPLDWVIILLGTNDCGPSYHRDVSEIALAVPRCFGPCRNRLPARPAECPRCCWSHLQRSASSRRSWTFSFMAAKRPAVDWGRPTPRLPRRVARVSSTRPECSLQGRSMVCIPTPAASASSAKRSPR